MCQLDLGDERGRPSGADERSHSWSYQMSNRRTAAGNDRSRYASSLARRSDDIFGTHRIGVSSSRLPLVPPPRLLPKKPQVNRHIEYLDPTVTTPQTTVPPQIAEQRRTSAGTLHAAMTEQGARAWLGERFRLTLWPEGTRVRFDPTELLGPDGEVLRPEAITLGARMAKVATARIEPC